VAELKNSQHELFCKALIGDARFNASEAARIAKYSPRTAGAQANNLLKRLDIRARVKELMDEQITDERIAAEVLKVALSDLGDIVDISAAGLKFKINADTSVIQSIRKGGKIGDEVRFHDKLKALELLMKFKGMLKDRIEHSGSIAGAGLAEIVRSAADEIAAETATGGSDE
jgi:phage terminase small subunit